MAPTRELSLQTFKEFETYGQKLVSSCIYGGAPYEPQGTYVHTCIDVCIGHHTVCMYVCTSNILVCVFTFACTAHTLYILHIHTVHRFHMCTVCMLVYLYVSTSTCVVCVVVEC